MQRIAIGMSGGVDSSLAAVLLKEQGHEVIGVSMKLWPCGPGSGEDPDAACCQPADALAVAQAHGIPHYTVDFETAFRQKVADPFVAAWGRGQTPNPCVGCNETVKFGELWQWARQLGATALATGHYARVATVDGRRCPAVPADRDKDQTYFLFSLDQDQLAAARFPLGDLRKDQVRAEAARRGLIVAAKDDSQDLCFVGSAGLEGWLRQELPDAGRDGAVYLHGTDRVIGRHRGLVGYTVGQRKGLGIAWSEPLYVTAIDAASNTLTVGTRRDLLVETAILGRCRWHLHASLPAAGLYVRMRNRHRAQPVPATLLPTVLADGQPAVQVRYHQPVARPSPGQAGVAYDPELRWCLGGGWFL